MSGKAIRVVGGLDLVSSDTELPPLQPHTQKFERFGSFQCFQREEIFKGGALRVAELLMPFSQPFKV